MKSRTPTTKFEITDHKGMTLSEAKVRITILETIIEMYKEVEPNRKLAVYKRALKACVRAYVVAQGKMVSQKDLDRIEQIFLEEARKDV